MSHVSRMSRVMSRICPQTMRAAGRYTRDAVCVSRLAYASVCLLHPAILSLSLCRSLLLSLSLARSLCLCVSLLLALARALSVQVSGLQGGIEEILSEVRRSKQQALADTTGRYESCLLCESCLYICESCLLYASHLQTLQVDESCLLCESCLYICESCLLYASHLQTLQVDMSHVSYVSYVSIYKSCLLYASHLQTLQTCCPSPCVRALRASVASTPSLASCALPLQTVCMSMYSIMYVYTYVYV